MMGRIAAWLSETVMGFLALAALCFGLSPLLFTLSPAMAQAFDVAEWVVVALFALEYAANFTIAGDRARFALDPWRVLDLAIIVLPLASLLPFVSDAARSSPVLRILRLLRALLFGARAGYGLRRPAVPAPRPLPSGPPQVTRIGPEERAPQAAAWEDLIGAAAVPRNEWLHASNLTPERLHEISAAASVPRVMIEAALNEASYPRLEAGERWTALTLSLPSKEETSHRDPVLLLIRQHGLLSLALQPLELQKQPAQFESLPWGPRCALAVVRRILARNEENAGRFERETRHLEALPAGESAEGFFEQTFRLKRDLSMAKGDLWRLRGLLEMVADGRRTIPGLDASQREAVHALAEEADYLYETVDGIRESVLSLIDLHINIASHEMNRFMRLLAIVSALALIPAIAGGLLGMNLGDSPWPVTLGQVAFGTFVVMLGVLYGFMAKGWIR